MALFFRDLSYSVVSFVSWCFTKDFGFLSDRCVFYSLTVQNNTEIFYLQFTAWGHNKNWSITRVALWRTIMRRLSHQKISKIEHLWSDPWPCSFIRLWKIKHYLCVYITVSYVTLFLPILKTPVKCFSIAQRHYQPLNFNYITYKVISYARPNALLEV